jgi:hypothetical protein
MKKIKRVPTGLTTFHREGARVWVCDSLCTLVSQRYEDYGALIVVTAL